MAAPEITLMIRPQRLGRGYTLQQLAALAECSKSVLARIEVGQSDLDVRTLGRLARALDTSPWRLVRFAGWPCPCCCHGISARPEDAMPAP